MENLQIYANVLLTLDGVDPGSVAEVCCAADASSMMEVVDRSTLYLCVNYSDPSGASNVIKDGSSKIVSR